MQISTLQALFPYCMLCFLCRLLVRHINRISIIKLQFFPFDALWAWKRNMSMKTSIGEWKKTAKITVMTQQFWRKCKSKGSQTKPFLGRLIALKIDASNGTLRVVAFDEFILTSSDWDSMRIWIFPTSVATAAACVCLSPPFDKKMMSLSSPIKLRRKTGNYSY